MIFITGAAGFIGSNFAHYLASKGYEDVVILDKLTYAGNMDKLYDLKYPVKGVDIADDYELTRLFAKYKPRSIFNFAAETHVDNSINEPDVFAQTNIIGTQNLLNLVRGKTYGRPLFGLSKQISSASEIARSPYSGVLVSELLMLT